MPGAATGSHWRRPEVIPSLRGVPFTPKSGWREVSEWPHMYSPVCWCNSPNAISTSASPICAIENFTFDAGIEWIARLSDKYHVAAINFEAGDHAMPQNPLEIDLALRAAKVAWEKYPYLAHRYGERGRRFTDSDSCWLVTLTRAPSRPLKKDARRRPASVIHWLR